MKYFRLLTTLTLLIVFAFLWARPASADVIRLATLKWEPYIGENIKENGFTAAVVREAFARQGHTIELHFLPWWRAVNDTQNGKYHALFPEYFDRQRLQHFLYSAPIQGGPLALLARRGSSISYSGMEDLKPYKIGVVRGYINTREFDNATYLNKVEVLDDLTTLKMLLYKRVDLIVIDYHVARFLLQNYLGIAPNTAVEPLYPMLDEKLLYLCFSKQIPQNMRYLVDFNTGLLSMKNDGTYDRLVEKFNFDLRNANK